MNILCASTYSMDTIIDQFKQDKHTVQYLNLDIIDGSQLMQLESWADQIYCLTKKDMEILSFMEVFKRKIKVWDNLKVWKLKN